MYPLLERPVEGCDGDDVNSLRQTPLDPLDEHTDGTSAKPVDEHQFHRHLDTGAEVVVYVM